MTQMRGEGGQDSLNFPGRLDNQLLVLYSNIVGPDCRLGSPVTERHKDLKPQTEQVLKRAADALKTDVDAFNAVATKAGLQGHRQQVGTDASRSGVECAGGPALMARCA